MALKTCPACNKQVGPRTKKCECGHAFTAEASTAGVPASGQSMSLDPLEKRIAESVNAAKDIISKVEGRPSKASILPTDIPDSPRRTTIADDAPEAPAVRQPVRHFGGARTVISTPAGACPVKPQGYKDGWPEGPASDEVVQAWAVDLYNHGEGRYAVEAVIYWARTYWDINGPEYRRVRDLIVKALSPQRPSHEPDDVDEA